MGLEKNQRIENDHETETLIDDILVIPVNDLINNEWSIDKKEVRV